MSKRRGRAYVPGQNAVAKPVDMSGIDDLIRTLGVDIEDSVRAVAQAAAQVMYEAVKHNVAQIKKKSGNLDKAIYQKFIPEQSVDGRRATYKVSWNVTKAPHGKWLEWGHYQRYRYYQNAQGQVRPMVRPGMDGTKKPGKHASQAVKDAYYVTLDAPKLTTAYKFVAKALDKAPDAVAVAELRLIQRINGMQS